MHVYIFSNISLIPKIVYKSLQLSEVSGGNLGEHNNTLASRQHTEIRMNILTREKSFSRQINIIYRV